MCKYAQQNCPSLIVLTVVVVDTRDGTRIFYFFCIHTTLYAYWRQQGVTGGRPGYVNINTSSNAM